MFVDPASVDQVTYVELAHFYQPDVHKNPNQICQADFSAKSREKYWAHTAVYIVGVLYMFLTFVLDCELANINWFCLLWYF